MIKHINIKIYGKVQGVFFRAAARDEGAKLGIKILAGNKPDGSVYIKAEGDEEKLDQFIKWCHHGPPMARVEKVSISEDKLKDFSKFEIY